ncbi:hypothetical protein DPEC_G00272200 [Dallia pectoralis]|uniref:Uncharacterized protein n=1 Tax=Dallia pectoralis TaxID=75939 RepID=A0ACC2FPZ1_DALPE|nr:hypothetical protein DPEC_G00272200 [Dallia pectoralis]
MESVAEVDLGYHGAGSSQRGDLAPITESDVSPGHRLIGQTASSAFNPLFCSALKPRKVVDLNLETERKLQSHLQAPSQGQAERGSISEAPVAHQEGQRFPAVLTC